MCSLSIRLVHLFSAILARVSVQPSNVRTLPSNLIGGCQHVLMDMLESTVLTIQLIVHVLGN